MKRISMLVAVAAIMTVIMVAGAAASFAQIAEGPGKGNPETNPAGKCPPGQNQETSPGGLKKCP